MYSKLLRLIEVARQSLGMLFGISASDWTCYFGKLPKHNALFWQKIAIFANFATTFQRDANPSVTKTNMIMPMKSTFSNFRSLVLRDAFTVLLILMTTMTVGCGGGSSVNSEKEEFNRYSSAIMQAQDSGNYQRVLHLSKEVYDISLKGHSAQFRAHAAATYGQILILTGQAEEGKRIVDEVMKQSSDFSNDTVMGDIYDVYGVYEMAKGQNVYAANEFFLKALDCARRRKDKLNIAGALSNLSSSMTNLHDTTGLKYALESYQLSKSIGKPLHQAYALVNIISQMKYRHKYAEAAQWLDSLRQVTSPTFMGVTVNTLQADIYRETNQFDKATQYIDLAIATADTSKTLLPMEKENAYLGKANVLCKQGRAEESNRWVAKVEELSRQSGVSIPQADIARIYAINHENLGNYQKALEYRNQQIEILNNNTNADRIKIQKAKEVALDIAGKEAEIERHQEQARMLKWILWGTIGFIVLLIGLCAYIYNMYRKQQRLMEVVVERSLPEEPAEEKQEQTTDDRHAELFRRMKHEIDDNKMFLDMNISREMLADHLGTNRTYISEAVSQMTGMSFPQYISSLRVKEAEQRLHDPAMEISNFTDFGRSLGFASLSAFQAAFKRHTGMTLSAYRDIARRRPASA